MRTRFIFGSGTLSDRVRLRTTSARSLIHPVGHQMRSPIYLKWSGFYFRVTAPGARRWRRRLPARFVMST